MRGGWGGSWNAERGLPLEHLAGEGRLGGRAQCICRVGGRGPPWNVAYTFDAGNTAKRGGGEGWHCMASR